ncbi:hypothetical protein KM043_004740 [Ampulex compressa]|nr:hypothetical protein KM043_004740 [Ampulex compressa]
MSISPDLSSRNGSDSDRRRTGRYVAGGTALALTLLGLHHLLLRGASTIAGVCIPAIIMASYVIWVLYSARKDRRKALRLATTIRLTEVIGLSPGRTSGENPAFNAKDEVEEGSKVTRAQTPGESIEDSTRHGTGVPDRASSPVSARSSTQDPLVTHRSVIIPAKTTSRSNLSRAYDWFTPVNRAGLAPLLHAKIDLRREASGQMMKGRHQFRRRFSLQPSSLKEGQEDGNGKNVRNERLSESDSGGGGGGGGGKSSESSVRHKIVVMGAAKVGKSAIINQFLYGIFSPKYKRTIEEMHHGDFNVSGIQLTLDILDTSGSYEFPAMRDLSIKSADAFVLVYDVNDSSTFLEVKTLRAQILSVKGAVPIVVVGNKVDLVEEEQEVEPESTRELVTTKWENGFVMVSAKENLNISQVFKELLIQAKLKYNLSPALRRRRRQSLPPPQHFNSRSSTAHVPSPAQLQHLQQIRERSDSKRNSCILS